ncbi:hypothetical protein CXB51_023256 [Gossypium anomalum]|uniref:Uncharacterized protein n=1 Tax=Gossypium anomalum TaxID=47600 RepID=A0A8J5Y8K4_9ROSI|nr:hypothetical protein CXB51_029914 [Gossypium anomalum]KAG8483936.1 hypothetical protein CXB51_023256 [Gossypium anomalum]
MAKQSVIRCLAMEVAPAPIIFPLKPSHLPRLETIVEDADEEYGDNP